MKEYHEINPTADWLECAAQWTFDERVQCWCLEDVLYTPLATTPAFQRMSIFVPAAYLNSDGSIAAQGVMNGYTAKTAPVVFENNSAGYMQMPHTWLGGPRSYAAPYLACGMVYVTCGCRGRDTLDEEGRFCGKAPITLVDLKTAIRFLRHHRRQLPGSMEHLISVGWSAGGAMSTLLGVTGNHPAYQAYLKENGAYMEESDAVFASQIYCPIIDLEHADMAYEWMFGADKRCEDSPCGPAETMLPFQEALSADLARRYVDYINGLGLRHPQTNEPLTLTANGRAGSFYDYFMGLLGLSAAKFLRREEDPQAYLLGHYEREMPVFMPPPPLPEGERPLGLGQMLRRPPKGEPFLSFDPPTKRVAGRDKRMWLHWDGENAAISDLDTYVLDHRRRMKPCTAFDKLPMDSGENQLFGTETIDYVHFSEDVKAALLAVQDRFPKEAGQVLSRFDLLPEQPLKTRCELLNPIAFIKAKEDCDRAAHYRIRVGAGDADTSLSVSMTLALMLQNAGYGSVDYAMVWDAPHSEADYPGEMTAWIDQICK